MSNWEIVNGDCTLLIDKYINKNTIIVTDPPFNIGYHYKGYNDNKDDIEFFKYKKPRNRIGCNGFYIHCMYLNMF